MKRRLCPLTQSGFDHVLLPLACFVVFALIGSFYLYHSLAATSVQWKGVLEDYRLSSGYCLTTTGSTKASLVELDPCSKTYDSKQVWSLVDVRKATVSNESNVQEFYLQSADGGECIDNWGASKKTSYPEKLYPCSTTDSAVTWIWGAKFTSRGYSSHQLSNMAAASMCLDDRDGSDKSGTYVGLYTCKTTAQSNQEWFEQGAPSSSGSGSGSGSGSSTSGGCTSGGAVAPCIGSATTGASGYGKPVFDDEFDKDTSLNTSDWIPGRRLGSSTCTNDCAGYNPSSENEVFSSSQVSVSGGSLNIKATENASGSDGWTSGAVEMNHGKNFVYGFFEARIKVPDPSSAWTAYWLNSAGNWPPELDIFEFHFCNSQPTFNNHGTNAGTNANASGWPCGEAYGGSSTNFSEYHTYGLLWTSSSIKLYFDGVLQSSLSTTGNGIPKTPMYPIFNYSIADGDNPTNNSEMQVQYMRIWCPGGGTSCMTSNT